MKKQELRILITLCFFIVSTLSFSNRVDSLQVILKKTESADDKAKVQFQIAAEYYSQNMFDKAIEYLSQSMSYAQETEDTLFLAKSEELYGDIYTENEDFNLAIEYFQKSLVLFLELDSSIQIATLYGKVGVNHYFLGAYDKTIENYLKSLAIFEKLEDQPGIAKSLNNIGTVHLVQKNFDLAHEYFTAALNINKALNRKKIIAQNLNNLGILSKKKGEYQKAIEYYQIALEINKELGDSSGIARDYNNIGTIYLRLSDHNKALDYYTRSLKIKMGMGKQRAVAQSLGNIANLHMKFASSEKESKSKHIKKAIEYANKSLLIAEKLNLLEEKYYAYSDLSDAYEDLGDYKKALTYKNKYVEVINSLNDKDKKELSRSIEAKYQFNKKTRKIERQKYALEKAEDKAQKQELLADKEKNLRNFFIIIFLLMTVLAAYVFYHFKQKKEANRVLKKSQDEICEKNEELNQQNEEILAQRDDIETKRNLLEEQKEDLEELHGHLTKSIDYAERIQASILSNPKDLRKYVSDLFNFYRPRDIVSGDFYWWSHVESHTVIAAGDSTGHGVPGAFMSMLGISFLREIVVKEYITHPGVILRKLRKEVVHSLKQTGKSGEQKDGMDMALISINHDTKMLQYAGANNPIYIIKSQEIEDLNDNIKIADITSESNQNKFFYEVKPDKMPIAIYDKMDRFHMQEIQLQEGDQLYMFSDGFADQFGGPKPMGKKFKYKAFKRLILENCHLPMCEQEAHLIEAFDQWKGTKEQVDDILVLGIKV